MAVSHRVKYAFISIALVCILIHFTFRERSLSKLSVSSPAPKHGRRTSGREIAAELAAHRKEFMEHTTVESSLGGRGNEVLDLTSTMESRSSYYSTPDAPLSLSRIKSKKGSDPDSIRQVIEGLKEERHARFAASTSSSNDLLPSSKLLPLVVLVAGFGAEQAWPTLMHLDAARVPVVSSECEEGTDVKFDLVLLVPHGHSSNVLPCFNSQGCRSEGLSTVEGSGLKLIRGSAPLSPNEDLLALEAVQLFDQSKHSSLVVVSASSIVSAGAIDILTSYVTPSIAPAKLDIAVPVVYGLFGGGSGANSIDKWYNIQAGDMKRASQNILSFVGHPLNVARMQQALNALPTYNAVDFESGLFGDQSEDSSASGMSVIALSPKGINKLKTMVETINNKRLASSASSTLSSSSNHGGGGGHDHGLVHILRKITESVTELNSGVVKRAFAHWNLGYHKNVYRSLDSVPESSSPSLSSSLSVVKPTMKVASSSEMTLVAICAAGVPDKTIGALHSLEAALEEHDVCRQRSQGSGGRNKNNGLSCSSPFHVVVGVSPFPGDRTADYLELGGVFVLRQPAPLGLSDLWNRIVRFAFAENSYAHLILSNNDVLIPPGAVGGVNALLKLEPRKIATVASQQGGSTDNLGGDGFLLKGAPEDVSKFGENFLNYRLTQKHLSKTVSSCDSSNGRDLVVSQVPRKQFVGFFWGITRELSNSLLLKDGSGRLINTTARLNFGQEAEIIDRLGHGTNVAINPGSYVHHFRGQTLGGCQNGHRDCAQWQIGHHADASYHINGYSPKSDEARKIAWWEPSFGNDSPYAWKAKSKKHGN